jgi:hypothetical protein
MTDNEKIARFAGWPECPSTFYPKYSTDAEAVQLLNVLVEKGYAFSLYSGEGMNKTFGCCIWKAEEYKYNNPVGEKEDTTTIHEAITSAVLQVIEKETHDESR